jgi:hypothetical protein
VDYVPNAEIRALLTIVSDDNTPGAVLAGETDNTVIVEFKIGDDSYALADFFEENQDIAFWFNVPFESDIYSFQFAGGALLNGSLANLRDKLLQIGQARLGVPTANVQPVLFEGIVPSDTPNGTPKPNELETNQSAVPNGGAGQPLASIARYRVTIKFARTP